jgi:hypothetical protein
MKPEPLTKEKILLTTSRDGDFKEFLFEDVRSAYLWAVNKIKNKTPIFEKTDALDILKKHLGEPAEGESESECATLDRTTRKPDGHSCSLETDVGNVTEEELLSPAKGKKKEG